MDEWKASQKTTTTSFSICNCIDLDAFELKPPNLTTPLDNLTRFGDRLPTLKEV
jgi:hypothetical protein